MDINLANQILASFEEHLGDTPKTWLRALLLAADQQQLLANGRTSIALADLDKQLQLLGTQPPSDDARRQRLKTVNSVAKEELSANQDGKPPLQLKSRQKNIALSIGPGLMQSLFELLQSIEREQVRNATKPTTAIDPNKLAEPKVASKAQYQVFISHAWEDEDIETVVDTFVRKLGGKLRHLPIHLERQFSIKLYFDRKRIHGRSQNFEAQTDPACENSAFGLFLVSDKWYASSACKREVNHFRSRRSAPDNLPYIKIQLCGERDSTEEQPLYPAIWDQGYSNLLDLFSSNSVALNQQEKFLDRIREEICDYLIKLPMVLSGTGAYTSEHDAAIKNKKTVSPQAFPLPSNRDLLPKQELDDNRASEEILPLLHLWASSADSKNRVVALLGSFGSGKTVTSQLFARALADAVAKDPSQPEPIYLDLRRVQELYSIEAPIKPSLSQIIATALSKAEGAQLADAESILRFIRSQPCVVIFDGLDEIGNRIGVEAAAQLYRKLLEIVPAKAWEQDIKIERADWSACPARIMVTCRSHFFRNHLEEISSLNSHDRASHHSWPPDLLQRYYMAPLSREQVREVLIKNLGEAEGQRADALLQRTHDLPTLARKPILARYISDLLPELIETQQAGRALNTALVYQELFQRCIARDGEKEPLLNVDDRTRLLQALALELWQRRAAALPVAELDQWFDSYAESQSGLRLMIGSKLQARNLLHTELHNANLLVRFGDSDFAFVHSSFYEYFLALALFNCPDLQTYQDWPQLSAETCAFIWEIAINADKKSHDQFLQWQQYLLAGERPKSLRALIVQINRAQPNGWAPPRKANLGNLDLSDAIFGSADSDNICTDIDFTNANLRGCRFLHLRLQSCNFQGANIAQARFEHCHWQECSGTPSGVAAARAYRCNADPTSRMFLSGMIFVTESHDLLPDPKPHTAQSFRLTRGHSNFINSAMFSPDSNKVLTSSTDATAKVWDIETGICLLTLAGHQDEVNDAAFSADGCKIVTTSDDRTVKIWDAATGICLLTLKEDKGNINNASFSIDGKKIVVAYENHSAKVWDASTGNHILTLEQYQGEIRRATFDTNGNYIVTTSYNNNVKVWDAVTGARLLTLKRHWEVVNSAAFSSDGSKIVTASSDYTIKVWDTCTGSCLQTFKQHRCEVCNAAFSTDDSKIVTAYKDGKVKIWDIATEICLLTLDHQGPVHSALFSMNDDKIITLSYYNKNYDNFNKQISIWDAVTGCCMMKIEPQYWPAVSNAEISPDSEKIVTASADGTAMIWSTFSHQCPVTLRGHQSKIENAIFIKNGAQVVTASSRDETTKIWNANTGDCIMTINQDQYELGLTSSTLNKDESKIVARYDEDITGIWSTVTGACLVTLEHHDNDDVFCAVFNQNSDKVVTASCNGFARVWDASTGTCILTLEHHDMVFRATFSSDDKKIITACADDSSKVWDAVTGECLMTLDHYQNDSKKEYNEMNGHDTMFNTAKFSNDDRKIVMISNDGITKIWNGVSGICTLTLYLNQHQNLPNDSAFSNDSSKLVTSYHEPTAKVWDLTTGSCLLTLTGHEGVLENLTFSNDDRQIITASRDGAARLWDANSGQLLRQYQLLPEDNWAVLDGEGNVLRCSPGAWPYVYGLSADGKVTSPSNHPDWARISAPVATQQP